MHLIDIYLCTQPSLGPSSSLSFPPALVYTLCGSFPPTVVEAYVPSFCVHREARDPVAFVDFPHGQSVSAAVWSSQSVSFVVSERISFPFEGSVDVDEESGVRERVVAGRRLRP